MRRSLLPICYAFNSSGVIMFILSVTANVKFGLLDCVRCIGNFVIPGFVISKFCFIHFTLSGLKGIACHSRDFVIPGFVTSGFNCIIMQVAT